MKSVRSLFIGLLLAAASLLTSASAVAASTPGDPYAAAVASYVEAATKEMEAIRASAEASKQALPEAQRSRYRDFEQAWASCQQLLAELESATPGTFDSTKASYERARAKAVAELRRAQAG